MSKASLEFAFQFKDYIGNCKRVFVDKTDDALYGQAALAESQAWPITDCSQYLLWASDINFWVFSITVEVTATREEYYPIVFINQNQAYGADSLTFTDPGIKTFRYSLFAGDSYSVQHASHQVTFALSIWAFKSLFKFYRWEISTFLFFGCQNPVKVIFINYISGNYICGQNHSPVIFHRAHF